LFAQGVAANARLGGSALLTASSHSQNNFPKMNPRCDGTTSALRLAVGIMSRPTNTPQRLAVRDTWAATAGPTVLHCFLVGAVIKRTPRSPWDPRRAEERAEPDGGPKGEILPNPHAVALAQEHSRFGDVLVLANSAEIHAGGTSGLKTITWWQHVATKLPNVEWVGKCDDDTLINVPRLLSRLPSVDSASPRALFGTIKWGCYSDQRNKWEPSYKTWPCGRTAFARSQAPGEAANLSLTYEGPYELALGWLFAMPRRLAVLLAKCKYANWFHERALHATHEPFLRKEDDPLNGFWLYKCLREAGEGPVEPLRAMREGEAHNMACISPHGLYRRPSNQSIAVHFLKTVSAMRYVAAVLRSAARGAPLHSRECCARMVWPTERFVHSPSVCNELLTSEERSLEEQLDVAARSHGGAALAGKGRGARKRAKKALAMAEAARAQVS